MIDFDQLVDSLESHFGVAGDAVRDALTSLDSNHLATLTRHLDADQLIAMLDAAGIEPTTLPPDDLRNALKALAEAVSEVVDEMESEEPAKSGEAS